MMKFNSQICTNREQSERLLALGLKKETADCVVSSIGSKDHLIHTEEPIYVMESLTSKRIPNYLAWSLHRLIEIAELPQYWECISGNWYEEVIAHIQSMIYINEFNKDYLEE